MSRLSNIKKALNKTDFDQLNKLLYSFDNQFFTDEEVVLLNDLLIATNHRSHQVVARILQRIKSETSIPFIKKALDSNFDYLVYTCSEPKVITKWFSHILAAIGTKQAIEMIEDYCNSPNEEISEEMRYRLQKIKDAS